MIGRETWTAGRIAAAPAAATLTGMRMEAVLPEWARWRPDPDLDPWTVGLEEEIMLLEPQHARAAAGEVVRRGRPHAAQADDDGVVALRHAGQSSGAGACVSPAAAAAPA